MALVTIRLGGLADRAFVEELGRRTLATSASQLRPVAGEALEESYERLLDFAYGRKHSLLVAESSMERLGFLLLLEDLPDEVGGMPQGFIAYMAVEPTHEGHGVGTALLHRAEEIARERGLPTLALMVTEENAAARGLYAREGFQTERRLLVKAV